MDTFLALLAVALLTMAGIIGLVWLARVRAIRRVRAAANAYAERQIAFDREWSALARPAGGRRRPAAKAPGR